MSRPGWKPLHCKSQSSKVASVTSHSLYQTFGEFCWPLTEVVRLRSSSVPSPLVFSNMEALQCFYWSLADYTSSRRQSRSVVDNGADWDLKYKSWWVACFRQLHRQASRLFVERTRFKVTPFQLCKNIYKFSRATIHF